MERLKLMASKTASKIAIPDATPTHFYTGGRMVTYFPEVNANGYAFLKEDTEHLAGTLKSSTCDIQHVKKSYGVKDALVSGTDNAIIGAIYDVLPHDDGIDIVVKIERSVVEGFGFGPADFAPGEGLLSSYSQECEYDKAQASYIVVDKNDRTKIVRTLSYADGQALGLDISHMENGEWKYTLVDGNPVYMAVKPISFSGVGHVQRPADATATVSKMTSSVAISFVPGMDGENSPVADMAKPFMVSDYSGNDLTQYTQDFVVHPDLISSVDDGSVDKFHNEPDDPKSPDNHYAACWSETDYNNVVDGTPLASKTRLYRIKSDKGDYDRGRCIAAYHSILGMRGDVSTSGRIPFNVRQHALARVRHGLNSTKPKITKENSSLNMDPKALTDEQLSARIRELASARDMSVEDTLKLISAHKELSDQVTTLTSSLTEKETKLAALATAVETLQASLKERTDADNAKTRFEALDKILAFSDEEKADDKHVEFVKNLASLTETDFKVMSLERALAAEKDRATKAISEAKDRVLSGLPASPQTNPVPAFKGEDGTPRAFSHEDLY